MQFYIRGEVSRDATDIFEEIMFSAGTNNYYVYNCCCREVQVNAHSKIHAKIYGGEKR